MSVNYQDVPKNLKTSSILIEDLKRDKPQYQNIYIMKKSAYKILKAKFTERIHIWPVIINSQKNILDYDTFEIKYNKSNMKNFSIDYELSTLRNSYDPILKFVKSNQVEDNGKYKLEELPPADEPLHLIAIQHGGHTNKKNKKYKKIRKHRGIIQSGGNAGKLRKGYKYSEKILKNGLPQIIKTFK